MTQIIDKCDSTFYNTMSLITIIILHRIYCCYNTCDILHHLDWCFICYWYHRTLIVMTLVTIYFHQVHLLASSIFSCYNIKKTINCSRSSHVNRINSTWWWCYYYFHPCFIIIFYLLHSSFTTTELQGSCSIYSCLLLESRFIFTYLYIHIISLYMMYTSILSVLFSTVLCCKEQGGCCTRYTCMYVWTYRSYLHSIHSSKLLIRAS